MRSVLSALNVLLVLSTPWVILGDDARLTPDLDHSKLLIFRDAQNRERPVSTKEDWQQRRKEILAGMERAMGQLPDRSNLPPLDMKVSEEFTGDGYRRLTISITSCQEDHDRIPAYLYLPTDRPAGKRVAAILALHPTGAPGKGIVDGNGKANRQYGRELAQRGYVVLAPDYPGFGDLAKYDFASDRYVSGTMKGIFNHMRCVDLLQSLDEVDGTRIGVIGHSLGGHNSMFVATFDERLKVVVSSCGWCPFHDYYGGKITGWTGNVYMPRIRDEYLLDPNKVPFDFYEVVGALAPRPFLSISPLRDANFDSNGVKKAIPVARTVYDLYGASDRLQVRYPDCDHDFPDPGRREAYEFMDQALSHTPVRMVP